MAGVSKVYISFSPADATFVERVRAALAADGLDVFAHRDSHDLVGDEYLKQSREIIGASEVVLFVLSRSSASSRSHAEELAIAETLGKKIFSLANEPLGDIAPPASLVNQPPIKFYSERFPAEQSFANGMSALKSTLDTWWRYFDPSLAALGSAPNVDHSPIQVERAPTPEAQTRILRDQTSSTSLGSASQDGERKSVLRPSAEAEALSHQYARQVGLGPENVVCSVFAPLSLRSRTTALIQVFLHGRGERSAVARLASEVDPQRGRQISKDLELPLKHGQQVDIEFEPAGLKLSPSTTRSDMIVWRGLPASVNFEVTAPWSLFERRLLPMVRVSINGAPIGSIQFAVKVGLFSKAVEAEFSGDARRYGRAFLSYSSEDRAEVLKRAQAFNVAGIEFFQDILSLEAGERWSDRLKSEIENADVFCLFWSKSAVKSKWVMKETRHALKLQKRSRSRLPAIVPIILEVPPPLPPRLLKHIHFNDPISPAIALYGRPK